MDENRFAAQRFTIERALDGEGRPYSGSVEAVDEFGLGCVFWTNLCRAIHPLGQDW